jgi:flagellar hook-basal body protein
MSFQQGLSGLNGAAKSLDVIGNNIANSSTVGFKGSTTEFADVYARSLNGAGGNQAGIGVAVAGIAQQFTQGNIETSNNPLDIAINGAGFFRTQSSGLTQYTRNGQFSLDKSGFIVTPQGANRCRSTPPTSSRSPPPRSTPRSTSIRAKARRPTTRSARPTRPPTTSRSRSTFMTPWAMPT